MELPRIKTPLLIASIGAGPFFLTASLSHAAVVFDGANGASGAASSSLAWSHTVSASTDSILMLAFSYEDGSATSGLNPSGITFGSQNFTQLLSVNSSGSGFENVLSIWYLMNPAAGTATITIPSVTLDTPGNLMRGSSVSFSGVSTAPTQFGSNTTNNNTVALLSFTAVPSGSALYNAVGFSGSTTGIGTTSPLLTVPTGGSFNSNTGQAAHHAGYNLNVGGNFSAGSTTANGRVVQAGVILSASVIPEPSMSFIWLPIGGLLLARRKR